MSFELEFLDVFHSWASEVVLYIAFDVQFSADIVRVVHQIDSFSYVS